MRAPLTVSIQDTAGVWHFLPEDVQGVTFTTEAPCGCTEATIPIDDHTVLPDIQQRCPVRITAGDTGETLWTGRLSSPVRQVRGALVSGQPSFEGQAGMLGEQRGPYTPLVTRLDAWVLGSQMKPYVVGATAASSTLPTDAAINALVLTLPNGYVVNPYCSLASFNWFGQSGAQGIRAMIATHREGAAAANRSKFQTFIWHGSPPGQLTWSSSAVGPNTRMTHLFDPSVTGGVTIGLNYLGAGVNTNDQNPAVTSDELWSGWWNIQMFAQLHDLTGAELPDWNPIPTGGIRPHEVVGDVLGTFIIPPVNRDPAISNIDTSSPVILTSYEFAGQVSPAVGLADLNALIPSHYWWAGPADDEGSFPVSWLPWSGARTILMPPGAVTYDESAGDVDLANLVPFSYTDDGGYIAYGSAFADPWKYPDTEGLDTFVSTEMLDLTSLSSYSAAAQVATAYLGEVATLPRSATATVSVPVVDKESGALLPPWALTAGCMAYVPESGQTLPVTKAVVDKDTATATLTLGRPRRTTQEIVSTMSKHRRR